MNSDHNTSDDWEALYQKGLGAPRYPNGHVVRWLFGNFPRQKSADITLLDMGCGIGRHAMMMRREGFCVTATDYSRSAIEQATIWAKSDRLDLDFQVAPATVQPFPDEAFDGILCYGVLYYLAPAEFAEAVKEIYRLLKPGGKTFVMVKNDRDIRKTKGEETAPYCYKIINPDKGQPWHNEAGMALTLLPKSEVIKYFQDFSALRIEEITSTLANGKYREAAWLIYAEK